MQGLFSLMLSFESITSPAVQKQLLEHSLQLMELSQESRVRLLCHEARSAGQLMGLLRDHAPDTVHADHLLMLRGPFQDMVLPWLSQHIYLYNQDLFVHALHCCIICRQAAAA